jgi:hypothetical protein
VIDMISRSGGNQAAIGFGAARNAPVRLHVAVEDSSSGVRLVLVCRDGDGDLPLVFTV